MILELLIVCATVIALALIWSQRQSVRTDGVLRGHRVTIHTLQPDDQTLHGVLVRETPDRLVLADAEYVTPAGPTGIPGGMAVVLKRNVSWLQEHGSPTKEA